jgi:7-carboxy-7-deazaguanine synthase
MSATVTSPSVPASFASGAMRLKLTELFLSIQGEADAVGWPTVFVRLTGCPLRCGYCDTTYAFQGGDWVTVAELIERVSRYGVPRVCVTGGEPLAQKASLPLMTALCDAGFAVSIETSGALDVGPVDPRVVKVMDLKTPASGESARNRLENLPLLTTRDQIKFVVCDRGDYEWARGMVREHGLERRCTVLFSPGHDTLAPQVLADWLLEDRLPVRLQIQLHKYLWGDVRGR